MQKRKSTLIVIIVLLILFVPLAIASTVLHFKDKNTSAENPNHEFLYNGKLYFYQNDTLLGTYTCENTDYCDYAVSKSTFFPSVIEHEEEKLQKTSLIKNRYAFLMDTTIISLNDAEMILYDLETQQELGRYKEVKNYGIGINDNTYIVKNKDDVWGVIEFSSGVNVKIPFEYDYIALSDRIDVTTNHIAAEAFSVYKDNTWYLVDERNTKISETLTDTIVTYDANSIITSNGNTMHLLNYQGRELLAGNYKYLNFCKNYIAIVEENNIFYLYDLANDKEIGNRYTVQNPEDLSFEITDQYIRISVADELISNKE